MKSVIEIGLQCHEQINSQFSCLASCRGDLRKTGELLDSPLLSEIDEVIKNLPQEKVLGPGGATGDFSKILGLVLPAPLLDELSHVMGSGEFIPASLYIQIILIAEKDKETENCTKTRFRLVIKVHIEFGKGLGNDDQCLQSEGTQPGAVWGCATLFESSNIF